MATITPEAQREVAAALRSEATNMEKMAAEVEAGQFEAVKDKLYAMSGWAWQMCEDLTG